MAGRTEALWVLVLLLELYTVDGAPQWAQDVAAALANRCNVYVHAGDA